MSKRGINSNIITAMIATVFDRRFALEDEGIVNPIHPFRWAMLDGDVQLRF